MHITIFTTGGTIDKVYFDAKSDYEVGEPLIGEILQEANVNFEFDVHTLFQKDSLDLTDADRFVIVENVRECADQHIVITHGTDTMVDTAQAIEAAETGKTVVLVGALNPEQRRHLQHRVCHGRRASARCGRVRRDERASLHAGQRAQEPGSQSIRGSIARSTG